MSALFFWAINGVIFLLTIGNVAAWGQAIKNLGKGSLSISFVFKLAFNPYFILAISLALLTTFLSYVILAQFGVINGRFFLSTGSIATIVGGTLILHEKVSTPQWAGIVFILVGVVILGIASSE